MKIAIGADSLGYQLKEELKEFVTTLGHEVFDYGCNCSENPDYPDVAQSAVYAVRNGECDRGILICGTGIGMAIAANKVKGIRAAQCHDVYSAERAAKSNNAHIITLGALIVGPQVAKPVVKTWLESFFTDGPSTVKIHKIMEIEKLG